MSRPLALLLCACAVGCVSPLDRLDSGAGLTDGGETADAGHACDAGAPLVTCAAAFATCTAPTDLTGSTAIIQFGGALGTQYSPSCIQIKSGQTVTFSGDFALHPLAQACGPGTLIPAVPSGSSATFSACAPGWYGYYCQNHGASDGTGMAGAILVVP